MEEILGQDSFACHKTLNGKRDKRKQCAGHVLIKREDNAFYQLAIRTGLEEQLDLIGEELVFAGEQDLIEHHKNGRERNEQQTKLRDFDAFISPSN
uniref:Uncharacterized protein n=2 Tax=Vibrio TaxID=662 RepID=A0A0H3ZT17_9VIBR|nr:hypothetical protein [Vibrio cyclitrophicus]AKN38252.1 hypothetical protein [Vibrio splendidus]